MGCSIRWKGRISKLHVGVCPHRWCGSSAHLGNGKSRSIRQDHMFKHSGSLVTDHWYAQSQISILPIWKEVSWRISTRPSLFSPSHFIKPFICINNLVKKIKHKQVQLPGRRLQPSQHGHEQDFWIGIPWFQDDRANVWWFHQEFPRQRISLNWKKPSIISTSLTLYVILGLWVIE